RPAVRLAGVGDAGKTARSADQGGDRGPVCVSGIGAQVTRSKSVVACAGASDDFCFTGLADMRVSIDYGLDRLQVEVADDRLVEVRRQPEAPALADPPSAVREALEHPLNFPPLRRALTPDDHVTVVVDEELPGLVQLLIPVLEHVVDAHVAPEAITLLCSPSSSRQEWVDDLPDAFGEVQVEVHDPADRKKLSYLATTKQGRRIYLNRSAVDADQLVVLSRVSYDPVLGYFGS